MFDKKKKSDYSQICKIDPSLSPALPSYCCHACQAFAAGPSIIVWMHPVSDIPNEIISNFLRKSEISERAIQKGLQYAFEGYIHDIIFNRPIRESFLKN